MGRLLGWAACSNDEPDRSEAGRLGPVRASGNPRAAARMASAPAAQTVARPVSDDHGEAPDKMRTESNQ